MRLSAQAGELRTQLALSAVAGNGLVLQADGLWAPAGGDSLMQQAAAGLTFGTANDPATATPASLMMTVTNPSATLDAYLMFFVWVRSMTLKLDWGTWANYRLTADDGTGETTLQVFSYRNGGLDLTPGIPDDTFLYQSLGPSGHYGPFQLNPSASKTATFKIQRRDLSDQRNSTPAIVQSTHGEGLYVLAVLTTTSRQVA